MGRVREHRPHRPPRPEGGTGPLDRRPHRRTDRQRDDPLVTTFPSPVVATAGSTDPAAPLVVLLHGRGSHEREILGLADRLPTGPAYAAVRAPIAEGGGY